MPAVSRAARPTGTGLYFMSVQLWLFAANEKAHLDSTYSDLTHIE